MEKEIINKIKVLIESLSEKEKSNLLAGIFGRFNRGGLFEIWQKYQRENLKEFSKTKKGKELANLFQRLKKLGYFDDFVKSKTKQGFIQIPILIVILILSAVATVGAIEAVKHKEEIKSAVANISSIILKSREEIIEGQKTENIIETSSTPEVIKELKEEIKILKQQTKNVYQIPILSQQTKDEVENLKKQEEAKIKAEQELQRKAEIQKLEEQRRIEEKQQQEVLIKIELCKNKAEGLKSEMLSQLEARLKKQIEAELQEHKKELQECFSDVEDTRSRLNDTYLLPSEISKIIGERTNQCVSVFNVQKDFYDKQYQTKMKKYREEADRFSRENLNECLNR